jgi:hypothetical protein
MSYLVMLGVGFVLGVGFTRHYFLTTADFRLRTSECLLKSRTRREGRMGDAMRASRRARRALQGAL